MSNLVLYRKYRPQRFAEIVGQEHVVTTLNNAIASGEIAHAYLFAGPRGTGKTTVARILAKAINCQQRTPGEAEPCNKCFSCQEITQGKALDIIEIDAASNRGIDEIRQLKEAIRTVPTSLKTKVYIIDETHMLTQEAFNALLKTLEEPPSHAIFVLATTEVHRVPPTIVSRVQRFDFKKLNLAQIISRLEFIAKNECVNIEKPALELIALNSQGSIRDAESLLGQVMVYQDKDITKKEVEEILGIVDLTATRNLVEFLAKKDAAGAIAHINKIHESGYDLTQFCKSVVDYLRYLLLVKIDKSLVDSRFCGFSDEELSQLCLQASNFSEEKIKEMLQSFIEAQNEIKRSSIPQLPLELAAVESCGVV